MLWSTRINSSRQVVGRETVWRTAGKPFVLLFAVGIRGSNADPTADGVTELFGSVLNSWFVPLNWPVATVPGQSANVGVAAGTLPSFDRMKGVPAVGHRSEKFPPRSAPDGTFCKMVEGFFSRRHSSAATPRAR